MISLAIVSGLSMGAMYGLLALGFHITYAVSSTVNFSQGTSLMLGAVLCYLFSVSLGWPILREHRRCRSRCARCGGWWSSASPCVRFRAAGPTRG